MYSSNIALVLGAAGFVGRHTSRALAAQGFVVHGLGHGNWDADERSAWGVSHWTAGDISNVTLASLHLGSAPLAIVHCAGSGAVSFAYGAPRHDFALSVETTADVLEWARQHGHGRCRIVLASSAAVYGDQGDVDVTESSTRSPISPYGFHKVAAEMICDEYSRFFSVPVSIVRLFSVYGEGLRKQLLWDASNKFSQRLDTFFGTGHEMRDWIHVDDAAALLSAAASVPQTSLEVFNGGHEHATTQQVLELLSRCFGRAAPSFNGETHVGNPRRLTSRAGHAHRTLGWSPRIRLADALPRYANWFNEQRIASDEAPRFGLGRGHS